MPRRKLDSRSCFLWVTFFNSLNFFSAIEVVFFQSKGLDFAKIFFLNSILSAVIIVFDVPLGLLADQFGKRRALIFGYSTMALAFMILALSDLYLMMIAAYILFGLSLTFTSGADNAYLFELLKSRGQQAQYSQALGQMMSISYYAAAAAALVSGFIFELTPQLPVLLNGIFCLVALVLASFLEPDPAPDAVRDRPPGLLQILRELNSEVLRARNVLMLTSLFLTSTLILVKLSQPLMSTAGLPLKAFGLQFSLSMFLGGVASQFAHHIRALGRPKLFLFCALATPILIFTLFALLTPGVYVFPILLLTPLIRTLGTIELDTVLHNQIDSRFRATVGSISNFSFRVVFLILFPAVGWVIDRFSLSRAFGFVALGLATGYLIIWLLPRDEESVHE